MDDREQTTHRRVASAVSDYTRAVELARIERARADGNGRLLVEERAEVAALEGRVEFLRRAINERMNDAGWASDEEGDAVESGHLPSERRRCYARGQFYAFKAVLDALSGDFDGLAMPDEGADSA